MSFSTSLKNLRKSRRITQSRLAAELGLSTSTISMYECGKREPELELLKKLAAFFGVDMNELTGQSSEISADPEFSDLLDALRSRSEMRMLVSVAKDAPREDVEKAVRIIEALRSAE